MCEPKPLAPWPDPFEGMRGVIVVDGWRWQPLAVGLGLWGWVPYPPKIGGSCQ